jgi:hypothetical protein
MEPEYHNTIFKKLCSGMNCLSHEQRETLQQWLQEVKTPMLRDAIVAFQQVRVKEGQGGRDRDREGCEGGREGERPGGRGGGREE